jgi:hypothetical protein
MSVQYGIETVPENLFDPQPDGGSKCRVTRWRAVPSVPRKMGEPLKQDQIFYILDPQDKCFGITEGLPAAEMALHMVLKAFNQGRESLAVQVRSTLHNVELSHGKLT